MDQCMCGWMYGCMDGWQNTEQSGVFGIAASACQKGRMKKTADLWNASPQERQAQREREMNRTRRRHTDGIKAFTIFSYRCESRHVSPPSFMAILQKFGVSLLKYYIEYKFIKEWRITE